MLATSIVFALGLVAQPPTTELVIVPERSHIVAIARADPLATTNATAHAVLASAPSGRLCLVDDATGSVDVAAQSLAIDTPKARRVASLEPTPQSAAIQKIKQALLSSAFLDAAEHPTISFRLSDVELREPGGVIVDGIVAFAGREVEVHDIAVDVKRTPDALWRATADVALPATQLGIDVSRDVEFRLVLIARRTANPCP